MAKQQQSTSSTEVNAFSGGMQKDIYPSLQPKEQWSHARNAANNSVDGDVGVIGNEPANLECAKAPYTIIGGIHTYGDEWVIFSTDDIDSEIGLFDDSTCTYKTLVNDKCLNFNRKYLITGAAKENYDCSWQVYWDDSNNPSRTLNLDNIPYKQEVVSAPGADCVLYEDTTELDCEKIRLAPLFDTPCIKLNKNVDGGQLRNGSYQVYLAYVENEQKVTDYIGVSNIQALFAHKQNGGSLDIEITNLDKTFEYYELVVLSDNQGAKVATKIGIYSTEQSRVTLDFIDPALVAVELSALFLRSPAYEKSESMYVVNDYLIRQGPTEQFDFNYQPLANNIQANWIVAEYDAEYYYRGGNKTQFMRDEIYSFFIRWIYNTGEKSSSYHIPGRAPLFNSQNQFGQSVQDSGLWYGDDVISDSGEEYVFQVYNTATITPGASIIGTNTDDGGEIIATGNMGYWQSTERYPATKPEIWADLCGKEIRHHKFPTEELGPQLELSSQNGSKIRVLGVQFSGIQRPLDNDGNVISNIVGYEILRGSREGAKSILAKGIFRNMRVYDIPDSDGVLGPKEGLYANYPYNDLRSDVYFHDGTTVNGGNGNWTGFVPIDPLPKTEGCDNFSESKQNYPPLTGYKKDVFTFHSPELMFRRPFLNPYEVRLYGAVGGESVGSFRTSEDHPQNKLLRNGAAIVAGIIGVGYAIGAMQGEQKITKKPATNANAPWMPIWIIAGLSSGTNAPGFNAAAVPASTGSTVATVATDIIINALLDDGLKIADVAGAGGIAGDLGMLAISAVEKSLGAVPGNVSGGTEREQIKKDPYSLMPTILKAIMLLTGSRTNIAFGAQKIIDLMYNLVSFEDFAFKYNSHGLFDSYHKTIAGERFRARNVQSNYLGSSFQAFNNKYKVNNLYRPDTVIIETSLEFANPNVFGAPVDNSRFCLGGDSQFDFGETYISRPNINQSKNISALYGALKFNFDNQYGQLEGIKQVRMSGCIYDIDDAKPDKYLYSTTPIFSGDTYVGRYSEKVIMPIFTDFLLGQPDQYPYNYLQRINIPYPRFWMDTRKYDTTELAKEITSLGLANTENALPNDLYYLDRGDSCGFNFLSIFGNKKGNSAFALRYGYMYTHVNGVLDFFVESEINLPQRDWEDTPEGRHYDNFRYTQIDDLFNANIQRKDNTYAYDYSLSASRFVTNLTSFGEIQPRDYNPEIAETCFTNYPKRLIYSLQAQEEAKKDFWRVFLPNNYKDFKDKVNIIKPINKSGAVIFFPYQSPQMFQGLDQLQTDLGTKLTIGDGGLFTQAMQNMVNSDLSNEYGSCESQRGVLNTPFGFFFISQAQGKIFQQNGQSLQAISNQGMKWWFNKYLPSNLIKQFPELEFSKLGDNPVIGVGCQVSYDVTDDIVYFSKRDFKVKEEYIGVIEYNSEVDCFVVVGRDPSDGEYNEIKDPNSIASRGLLEGINTTKPLTPIGNPRPPVRPIGDGCVEIGDPRYFNECSWTVSYDPKAKAWISFHDWHPELNFSSINHFLTTKTVEGTEPKCPPGYSYNPISNKCERLINETKDAIVSVDEVASIVKEESDQCLLDIVIALDSSGSTVFGCPDPNDPTQLLPPSDPCTIFYSQVQFVKKFVDNPIIQQAMIDGRLQIGFTSWSGSTQETYVYADGSTMGNQLSDVVPIPIFGAEIEQWYYNNWLGVGTNVELGFLHATGVLQDVTNSQLYSTSRYTDQSLKQILLFVPDGASSSQYTDQYGCDFQFKHFDGVAGALTGGDPNTFIYGIFSSDDPITSIGDWPPNTGLDAQGFWSAGGELDLITCSEDDYKFAVSSANPALTDQVVDAILTDICTSIVCSCPEGYTLVFDADKDGIYTDPEGDCSSERRPICRQVSCECPPSPDPDAIILQTGECDDVYLTGPTGDALYVNRNPLKCTYKLMDKVDPNFIVGGIWRHNYRCDLFANYYGVDYPWEVEIIENSGQNVNTVRSVEYQLESYVYKGDQFNACGDDKWHDLDFNFDEAIIYNTEQVSGLLRLDLNPKEDPINMLNYPIINANDIQILYSKEEQKYRFNQFWDITEDRGEFTNAERNILITQCNGYIRELNELNLNYNKSEDQRKKFRHYYNKMLLRRTLSNNRKMLLKLVNSKLNLSYR